MSRATFAISIIVAASIGWAATSSQTPPPADPPHSEVMAIVGGVDITAAQVEEKWHKDDATGFAALQNRRQDLLARVLDGMIAERLLLHEANRQGISSEELLKREVPKRARPITQPMIAEEFERLRATSTQAPASLEAARPLLVQYLTQRTHIEARDAYVAELRASSDLEIEMLIKPQRAEVPVLTTDPATGRADAPVTVILFSDFECPYCRQLEPILAQLQQRFGDDLRLVWKDFPKPSHSHARLAARAARCAHDQGAFFPYRDRVFAEWQAMGVDDLRRHAREIGLKPDQFEQCLDSNAHDALIDASVGLGMRLGVSGTPTFFVNGRAVTGAVPFPLLERMFSEELRR